MDSGIAYVISFARKLLQRLLATIAELPSGALPITGILGLAAVLAAWYRLQGKQGPKHDAAASGGLPGSSQAAHAPRGSATTPPVLGAMLGGARSVCVSVPGVLLEEWTPEEVEGGATLRPGAAALLRSMAAATTSLTLVAQVAGDVGEAVVRGALDDGGILGAAPGQLPAHRLLFCSTRAGKAAIVRQLEPGLHIDGCRSTVEMLARFIPRLLHVQREEEPPVPSFGQNKVLATSVKALLLAHIELND